MPVIQVYCRLRPLDDPGEQACAKPLSDTLVQLVPPDVSLPLCVLSPHVNFFEGSLCALNKWALLHHLIYGEYF